MKRKLIKTIICVMAAFIVSMTVPTSVLAYEEEVTMSINKYDGKSYSYTTAKRRSKRYSYVSVKLDAVRPISGKDTFTRARVRIFKLVNNSRKVAISDEKVLTEGQVNMTKLYLYDDEISVDNIYFGIIGNSSKYDAIATLTYNPN